MGVFSGPVVREIDLQLQHEIFHQNATNSGLQVRESVLQSIDALLGVPGQGSDLGSTLGALQDSFLTLQSDPSSSSAQSHVVSSASLVAQKINALSQGYITARQGAQRDIEAGLKELNSSITTISNISEKIMAAQSVGQSTADLENLRDAAMHSMSNLVDVSFIAQPGGNLLAATSGGLAIALRNPPPQFTMIPASVGPQSYYPGGGIPKISINNIDVTGALQGGSIGANIQLRDKTLPAYQAQLDEYSSTLDSRFSDQGLSLFSPPALNAFSLPSALQSGYLGYSLSISVSPTVLTNPQAVRDGNVAIAGSVTGASAFSVNPAGGPASFGDLIARVVKFTFGSQVQTGVDQSPPNVLGLGPLGNLSAPFAPPKTLADFATSIVAAQSSDASDATIQRATEAAVGITLSERAAKVSGVNTDTELAKMVELQNAYGATARIIAASQTMWTQLLSSVQ
jgi:flagellar hook-associated protein 1 FlgK